MPILRAGKLLRSMAPGDVLEVETDDQAAGRDFPAFCAASGAELRRTEETPDGRRFVAVKTAPPAADAD